MSTIHVISIPGVIPWHSRSFVSDHTQKCILAAILPDDTIVVKPAWTSKKTDFSLAWLDGFARRVKLHYTDELSMQEKDQIHINHVKETGVNNPIYFSSMEVFLASLALTVKDKHITVLLYRGEEHWDLI